MVLNTQIDQGALAAEWGVALEEESGAPAATTEASVTEGVDEAAAQWAAMVDDGSGFQASAKGGAERILNQEEIDSLLGFSLSDVTLNHCCPTNLRSVSDNALSHIGD